MSKTIKRTISFLLVLLMCMSFFPAAAFAEEYDEDIEIAEDLSDEAVEAAEQDVPVEDIGEDIAEEPAAEEEAEPEAETDLQAEEESEQSPAVDSKDAEETESSVYTYSRNGLTLTVTYPKNIVCGTDTVFELSASGGSGNYKYKLFSLTVVDGNEQVLVYDIAGSKNSGFNAEPSFTFNFCASGTYYIGFSLMDMGTYAYMNTPSTAIRIDIDEENYPSVEERVETVAAACLEACGEDSSDYDKALWLNDWLVDNCSYDYSYTYCSAEAALSRGTGTCEAYHRAYVKLLNRLGIQTGRVVGKLHVWTAVYMDGAWYQIDTTWNDAGYTMPYLDLQRLYFGLTDEILNKESATHVHETVAGCESTSLEENYFIKSGEISKYADEYLDDIQSCIDKGLAEFSIPVGNSSWPDSYKIIIYNIAAYYFTRQEWKTDAELVQLSAAYNNEDGGVLSFQASYELDPSVVYSIEFAGNGGNGTMEALTDKTVRSGNIFVVNEFERSGYSFTAWNTKADGTGKSFGDTVTIAELAQYSENNVITLYAQWSPISYTLKFVSNGGTGTMSALNGKTVLSGDISIVNKFKRSGYSFAAWNTKTDGTGESFGDTVTINELAQYSANNVITLYAQWLPIGYIVEFNANGGNGEMEPLAVSYGTEQQLTPNAFTREGYVFNGWKWGSKTFKDAQTVKNLSTSDGAVITMLAQWKVNTAYTGYNYKIYFNGNGNTGGKTAAESMKVGTARPLTGNGFTKKGYHFAGWATEADGEIVFRNKQSVKDLNIKLQQDTVTLYAVWEANSYSVSFNGNGGYVMNGTKKLTTYNNTTAFTYDTEAALDAVRFTRTGYSFKEWNSKKDGKGTAYADMAEVLNLTASNKGKVTLYAIWKYTVTIDPGIGEGTAFTTELVYNRSETVRADEFTRPGYYIAGWNKTAAGAAKGTVQYKTTAVKNAGPGATLYAVWKPCSYTIKFDANGGSGKMAELAMSFNTAKALRANAFKFTGHSFLGWSTDPTASTADFADKAKIKNELPVTANKQKITLYAVWG